VGTVKSTQPTVRIWCENLAAMAGNDRHQLSALAADSHIHGGLRLEIGGQLVPYLGYWGPDDVCFGQWLGELRQAARALEQPGGRHVFDEGEQGQPAFVFERDRERGFFSIAASEISGADGDPSWQRVEFVPGEFVAAYAGFRDWFVAALCQASPVAAKAWLARFGGE
jgi:hypothetical protein